MAYNPNYSGNADPKNAYPYPPPPQQGFPYGGPSPMGGSGGYPYPPQGGFQPGGFPPGQFQQGGFPPGPMGSQGFGAMPPTAGFHFAPPTQGHEGPKPDDYSVGMEDGGGGAFDFTEKTIRLAFIRKVYSILMIQLAITVGFIALFLYHEPTKMWTRKNPGFFFGAMIMTIVLLLAMACCEGVRRKSPGNFICLFLFTFCEGFVVGAASSTYNADAVLLAAGVTTVVCLALTAFSFQTKWDFTAMGGILFVAVIILFVFSILVAFLGRRYPILKMVYACGGALIFSIYLVYDTQLMMGGKHKYSISPEEYIFAALNLYLDIVQIFMYILTIIGSSND